MFSINDDGFKLSQTPINNILLSLEMNRIITILSNLKELNSIIDILEHYGSIRKFEMDETKWDLEVEYSSAKESIRFCFPKDTTFEIDADKISMSPLLRVSILIEILKQYRNHVKIILKGEMENYDMRTEALKEKVNSLLA